MPKREFWDEVGRSEHVAHLLPEELSDAGFWFLLQASKLTVTFHAYQWMSRFLTSSEWLVEDYAEFLQINDGPFGKASDGDISFYETTMLQMIWADEIHLTKVVDLMNNYLLDVIACSYRESPNLVPSKARFDLHFVRKFKTINDAVRGSALAEIERISRSGFSELLTEAKRVTNCQLPEEIEREVRDLVRLRNEIVHKQGSYIEIIGSMFNKKRKTKKMVQHKPGDTANAEVISSKMVGLFETAAISSGVRVAATKRKIFEGRNID